VQSGYTGSGRWLLLLSYHASGIGAAGKPADAAEFLLAGATAIQIETASYADPRATVRLARGAGVAVQEPRCGEGGQPDGGAGDTGNRE